MVESKPPRILFSAFSQTAGEDPSNSSFRRAMRKAAGTVSIVDKDAKCYTWLGNTVDGRNPANQLIGSLFHNFQGFIHPR